MFLGSRARLARKAGNLTAIFEPIVYTMWDPQHLTTLLFITKNHEESRNTTRPESITFSMKTKTVIVTQEKLRSKNRKGQHRRKMK
jgi:hypothetical protein